MWTILLLAGAMAAAYAAIRRFRLARENRERELSVHQVDSAFQRTVQDFSVAQASELVNAIQEGKRLRVKLLNPELRRLELALESLAQWNHGAVDPEQDRAAVQDGVSQLRTKWQRVRATI